VGTLEAMGQAANIVKQVYEDWPNVVVVTSALSGVTDLLLASASDSTQGDSRFYRQAAEEIQNKHHTIIESLISDPVIRSTVIEEIEQLIVQFTNLCKAISILGEASPRALDAVSSLGERMSVRLLSAVLTEHNLPATFLEATEIIITDKQFQSAHPDMNVSTSLIQEVIGSRLDAGEIPVVTGFIARSADGVTTTLGRGGSDYTAALIGALLPASAVWIWTDVNGVMTADPRLVPNAQSINELSYREVAELAYFGAKVLHPKSIRPVIEAGVDLRVCNTLNPDHPGTMILPKASTRSNGRIKAVTVIHKQCLITIEGRGMLGVPGVAARTFGAVAKTGTSVALISQASSEQSICFALHITSSECVIEALEQEFSIELSRRDIDRIWATREVVIVTVVGAGMRNTPGISGRVFSSLGAERVNVIAIAQGSSEVSISLIVDADDTLSAVRTLHSLIVPES